MKSATMGFRAPEKLAARFIELKEALEVDNTELASRAVEIGLEQASPKADTCTTCGHFRMPITNILSLAWKFTAAILFIGFLIAAVTVGLYYVAK